MKIDAKLHRWIDATFPSNERETIKLALAGEPEPKNVVCAATIKGSGFIAPNTLVMTKTVIGYGWPIQRVVLWKRGAPS